MDELMEGVAKSEGAVRLSNHTLAHLPATILRPNYDRSRLTPGIVHIGVGNFHRAHQSWYLHRLMQSGEAHDWALIGAGVRAQDASMRPKLLRQDCLTTLIELDPDGQTAEIVGSMIDFLPVEDGHGALIDAMADHRIRIVSMTVTEGGYYMDGSTGQLDETHPDILHDVANPGNPVSAFGAIVEALRRRRDQGIGPFTGLSCDNLQGNGSILRQTVVSLARLGDPELADWIDRNCSFPNSMVDCIVPATGAAEKEIARQLGVDDAAPVTHENFRQWVIEDDFCAGRPDWDQVGATFSSSVHAHEMMKLRILNGGHQLLANAGELLSCPTIADCMVDSQISAFFRKVELDEIIPYVDSVPGLTSVRYLDMVEGRFRNGEVRDSTRRVAFDGSSRHLGFLIPSIHSGLEAKTSVSGLALAEALWARMCAGTREDGSKIDANDPQWESLQQVALEARDEPLVWLSQSHLYNDLADKADFAGPFASWLQSLWENGTRRTLASFLGGGA